MHNASTALGATDQHLSNWEASLRGAGLLGESLPQYGTSNVDASQLPFQRWYRFKEAFAPAFVAETFAQLPNKPRSCLDPFGGSGTTSVTAQRLNIYPVTVEVNPFLADVIEAKLASYSASEVREAWHGVIASLGEHASEQWWTGAPPTFVEPGVGGRWILDADIAGRIGAYRVAIGKIDDPNVSRLFRVLLGSALIPASNVVISGKGRRYRGRATTVRPSIRELDRLLDEGFSAIYSDLVRFGDRPEGRYDVIRGDARVRLADAPPVDVILFSPPYPNSFDYTDIYNVELWTLGYLTNKADNRALREATLRSHVQITRSFEAGGLHSPTLDDAFNKLDAARPDLWSPHIPEMLRAYFADLALVLIGCRERLNPGGRILLVVGDSKYSGVRIDVTAVIKELAPQHGLRLERVVPVRSMRSSAQQGGQLQLSESLLGLVSCEM